MNCVIEPYLQNVKTQNPALTDDNLAFFAQGLSVSVLSPREFYIKAGEAQTQMGYVTHGLLRTFYTNEQGDDITVSFMQEQMVAAYYTSLESPQPSRYNIQALEKTTIINHSYEHLQACMHQIPAFERYGRLVIEEVLQRIYRRMEGFLFDDAEVRYRNFLKENPTLIHRVSVSHLCSYLGISRQALTRIRKKIIQPSA
ncbi:Crp/Fnr family transcriptional regulator [Capnocytophaga sp.]|uniref:Crp/Fnr family transcriptional regulator n=1 Tax=Capnocytophaga sp. TaxID=44737 RepID=UPI0026DC68D5|nr:Crp/Fnr family transcriptional regulator [Capnocytophaga sp.]MDO5104706.1 Crp/Fnr family transcriptional regulator [Capnocytophaga sp.]